MTEARQQNTEIRLAVGKVADKMDQLASKVGVAMIGSSSEGQPLALQALLDYSSNGPFSLAL